MNAEWRWNAPTHEYTLYIDTVAVWRIAGEVFTPEGQEYVERRVGVLEQPYRQPVALDGWDSCGTEPVLAWNWVSPLAPVIGGPAEGNRTVIRNQDGVVIGTTPGGTRV